MWFWKTRHFQVIILQVWSWQSQVLFSWRSTVIFVLNLFPFLLYSTTTTKTHNTGKYSGDDQGSTSISGSVMIVLASFSYAVYVWCSNSYHSLTIEKKHRYEVFLSYSLRRENIEETLGVSNLANGSMGLLNLVVMWVPVLFLSYVRNIDFLRIEHTKTHSNTKPGTLRGLLVLRKFRDAESRTSLLSVSQWFSRISLQRFVRRVSVSHISIHHEYCLCHNNTTCCFDWLFIMEWFGRMVLRIRFRSDHDRFHRSSSCQ